MTAQPQLELIQEVSSWRDPSARGQRNRDNALAYATQTRIQRLRDERDELTRINAELRQIQKTIITELAAVAAEKPMAIHEIVDELDRIIGTDHPNNITKRLGYKTIEGLKKALNNYGRPDLTEKLNKPQLNPYPQHGLPAPQQRARSGTG